MATETVKDVYLYVQSHTERPKWLLWWQICAALWLVSLLWLVLHVATCTKYNILVLLLQIFSYGVIFCGFGNNVYCSPEFLSCLNNNPIGIDLETALASWKFFPLEISNNIFCKFSPHWNELQCIRKYYHMLNQYFYVIALYVCTLCPLQWTLTYIWKKSIVDNYLTVFHLAYCSFLLVHLIIFSNCCCH